MSARFFSGLLALSTLAACGQRADKPVELDWSQGQMWHLATTYRMADVHGETGAVDLSGAEVALGELWSDEIVWTYQVIERGIVPDESDALYPFAKTARGHTREIDVVRAWIDTGLNDMESTWGQADPVVYMVFTSERQRLAGLVSYTSENGERVERSWSSKNLSRSWSPLGQSMLTAAPTYLAPYGVRLSDSDRKLENGSWLSTTVVDNKTVDAVFDDEIGGGVVASRYEVGQPWPTWTVANNAETRLLTEDEVNGMRRRTDFGDAPADYDFRAGLQASLDIDSALTLAQEDVDAPELYFGTPEGYQPWNGNWWPQSKGTLVFGYDNRDTLSDRLRDEIDPIKTEMDELSDKMRDDENDQESRDLYSQRQGELIDALVEFYNGVLEDLDGGTLTVADGKLSHADGWSYDLDELSPMDKTALAMYFNGQTYPNPFYVPAWELLNHYSPAGGSWWGHCNGWAAASILNNEPTEDMVTTINGESVAFTTADQKGLLSETHYSTWSHFFGSRYYKDGDDVADLTPAAFHRIIQFYLRDQQVPLVFDTDAEEQVWNFPAYGAKLQITEIGDTADLMNVNTADYLQLADLPEIGDVLAARIIDHREYYGPFQTIEELEDVQGIGEQTVETLRPLITVDPIERTFDVIADIFYADDGVSEDHVDNGSPEAHGFAKSYLYTLVTDENGLVLSGTWYDDKSHPDFAWVPYGNPGSADGSENAYLPHDSLVQAMGGDLSRL